MHDELSMDTDLARRTASQINSRCREIAHDAHALSNAGGALHERWHGPSAQVFFCDLERLLQQLEHSADRGAGLSMQLRREVEAWESMAAGLAETTD